MMKKALPLALGISLIGSALGNDFLIDEKPIYAATTSNSYESTFKDVNKDYYAKTEIETLVEKGVIKGFSDNTFRPENPVTRGEFATFVARALDLDPATSNFKDVAKDSPLYDGISKANSVGIIKGFSDGTFKGTVGVSREDMAVMIDRALDLKGKFRTWEDISFVDNHNIGAYAFKSVNRLVNYGVMSDYKNNKFEGKVVGTRAETAKFIYRMLEVIEKGYYADGSKCSKPTLTVVNRDTLKSLSLCELRKFVGDHYMIRRESGEFDRLDLTALYYYKDLHNQNKRYFTTPEDFFGDPHNGVTNSYSSRYLLEYSKGYEVISQDGITFTDSIFFENPRRYMDSIIHFVLPRSPKENDQFYIDIHTNFLDFATYYSDRVETDRLKTKSYSKDGHMMFDLKGIFRDVGQVEVTATTVSYNDNVVTYTVGSKMIDVNGKSVELPTSIEIKNNRVMIPIRPFAEAMGLHTRAIKQGSRRVEIANYELPLHKDFLDGLYY